MTEILSPKPSKQRPPTATRLQTSTSPFFLGSNDDQLERDQARAARAAAAVRRKALATPPPTPFEPCLQREQIVELFQNCIKLASENKINQKNTWELKLIDHLSEIIKVENEDDTETNFQKASCTLEAGVKIYSLRVDSVHSEAYKVLGLLIRASGDDKEDTMVDGNNTNNGPDEGLSKKGLERKISPLSTLEPSFESLNVKKFDVAYLVDPFYHQTSAQFDEVGAKSLLLYNLGVYGGCRVLFDSLEHPKKCISCSTENLKPAVIDLSFVKEGIEQMVRNMRGKNEISPTLKEIVCQFGQSNQRQSYATDEDKRFRGETGAVGGSCDLLDENFCGNLEAGDSDHEKASTLDESFTYQDTTFPSHNEENYPFTSYEHDTDRRSQNIGIFPCQGSRFIAKQNVWAGPDHWKYRKNKGPEEISTAESRNGRKKPPQVDIDFTKSLDQKVPDIFAPPKNPKLLLLPDKRLPWESILPEDCHFQPEDLIKLFLLPNIMCYGKKRRKFSGPGETSWPRNNTFGEQLSSWDYESVFGGQSDGSVYGDLDDSVQLVSQPCQVAKIEVQYAETSKQVDVHVLKETLWDHIQDTQVPEMVCKNAISFKRVLATFSLDYQAAVPEDVSPHLCFICLLHLANERALSISDCPTLDDLSIYLPSSSGSA